MKLSELKTSVIITILILIFLGGGVTGYFIGKPKPKKIAGNIYTEKDSLQFIEDESPYQDTIQATNKREQNFTKDYDSISKKHAYDRSNDTYDGSILERSRAIIERGKKQFGD